jgi:putative ATP-binding cassette transporter
LLFAALIALLFAINGLNVVNSYVGRDLLTAIADRSMNGLSPSPSCTSPSSPDDVRRRHLSLYRERLGLLWREWLTKRMLAAYLDHPNAYRLSDRLVANGEIANPDQRIADDIRAFTTTTLSFVLLILNGTFTVVAFSGVMWSISPLLFIVGALYAGAGSLLTILFGHSLVGLNYAQLDHEANFRSGLVHLRENAESVSVARHERQVLQRLSARLDALIDNARHIIGVNRNLGFFTTGYNYLIQIIPALIVAPLFIRGQVEFGVITQSAMAFSAPRCLLVDHHPVPTISSFTAVIARLGSLAEPRAGASGYRPLDEVCEHQVPSRLSLCLARSGAARVPTITIREEEGRIAFEDLTLRSPYDNHVLLANLSLSIPSHTRVLILGANDPAKIALFRVTAGIWENGTGRVMRPPEQQIQFLSERPYLPPGTLRDLLLPPGGDHSEADAKILALTNTFNLTTALARAGGVDTEHDWNDLLSLGEQQLFAAVRLILAAPQFAFLDRPQTILTNEQVQQILAALDERRITYITIGEQNGWRDRYDAELELKQDGTWTWTATRGAPA